MNAPLSDWLNLAPARTGALPSRCLFCNENLRVLLTGLKPGDTVTGVAPPCALMLLVTFGELVLEADGNLLTAGEGQLLLLNPGVHFRLAAQGHADFLVLCRTCPVRQNESAMPPTSPENLLRN